MRIILPKINNKEVSTLIWNTVYSVIVGKVDPEVKPMQYKGRLIGFCRAGCDEDFIKDPEKYLTNLNETGTKYQSIK